MGNISKNFSKGAEITKMDEIVRLANEGKSLILNGQIKPAAFAQNWTIKMLLRSKIYYAVDDRLIADIDFEEKLNNWMGN